MHHFGDIYHLEKDYSISLDTRPATFEKFFSRLKDFHLKNNGLKLHETISVLGEYPSRNIDTSMIAEQGLKAGDKPFQFWQ